MPNQRTRTGRGTSSTTDDVTRDAMLREEDDTMAGTEATGARQREYDKTADTELAAEIEAIKADDARKGKFYNRKRDV